MARTTSDSKSTDDLKPIFFWTETMRPEDHVVSGIPALKLFALVGILVSGEEIQSYRGFARCRIAKCSEIIGSTENTAYGYKYPGGCEHYIMKHGVWLPECEDLLEKALKNYNKTFSTS